MKKTKWWLSLALASLLCAGAHAADYKVIGKISLPGTEGWDYLTYDDAMHRLFVSRGTHVQVLNVDTGEVVGDVPNTDGVHGIALAPTERKGFTSNGKANTVSVFDLNTLKVMDTINVGKKPDCIIYDESTNRVLAMDGQSDECSIIDAATDKVVSTVALGGAPEFAAADAKGHAYVNLEDKSQVVEVDINKGTLMGTWSLAPGESPSGMAMDTGRGRLFIGCHNQMMVVFDTQHHKVLTTVPIGKGVDANGYDPGPDLAFSSNGDGTLTVVARHGKKYEVAQTVATQDHARTMAVDPSRHRVYLCTADYAAPPERGKRPDLKPNSFVVLVVGQ